jgi:hypothetical protein
VRVHHVVGHCPGAAMHYQNRIGRQEESPAE